MRKNSLQRKFMNYFIVVALVLFLIVGFLFYNNTKTIINASKENELTTLSYETSNKIERFLFERYGDIQVMAQSPLIKAPSIGNELKLEYLENVRKAYETYDYIMITDNSGRIKTISGNIDKKNIYAKAIPSLLKNEVYVSDFEVNSKGDISCLYFAAPIMGYNNEFQGAVIERMNFSSIKSIIKNVHLGKSGYAYLSNKHWKKEKSQQINFFKKSNTEFIAAFHPIKKYNSQVNTWYLVVEEPSTEAFKVTESVRNYTIILVLISVLGLIILAYIVSRFITLPIKKLVQQAENISKGKSRENVEIKTSDEIGSIAESFNVLLSNLDSMMQKVLELSGEAASLAEVRQYTNKFFNDIPGAIITLDGDGFITTFNEAATNITGITGATIIDSNINVIVHPELQALIKVLNDSLKSKTTYFKHIIEISNNQNETITIMVNTTLQLDTDEKTIGVICVFRRVDEVKQLEESIIRARNLSSLGELSAGMAHEIRNPLTSIRGYAQFIKTELGENSELTTDINIILSEVDRLNGIIDRFLTFARPKAPKFEYTELNDIIRDILNLIKKEEYSQNIEVKQALQPLPSIPLDYEQIKQAILNMVINSVQAMKNNGTLTILTKYIDKSDYVQLDIIDTGVGIATEDYDKIFEPFFTTKDKGTGLGLAISSRIIENHKGFIEVKSIKEEGTHFIIKLPLKLN